jgi:dTDP-4-dehydrorhamnose 3,5-epimerase
MKFTQQPIEGVWLIEAAPFSDHRGVFRRHFCSKEFADHGIAANVAQANVSENNYAGTLRGFHYQLPPHGEGKTLSCLNGAVYDIVVDLRKNSPTYKKWLSFELNRFNRYSLHVPPGCANAFLTLTNDVLVQYYVSEFYNGPSERGVRWSDPTFGFKWPFPPMHISDKDNKWPDFLEANAC